MRSRSIVKVYGSLISLAILILILEKTWIDKDINDHIKDFSFLNFSLAVQASKNKEWPDLELFLPTRIEDFREFQQAFARSFRFFWPSEHQRIVVVLDSEKRNPNHEKWILKVLNNSKARIAYNQPLTHYRKGWDRQQLIQFWADNFTNAEYVGFVDTDSMFVTPVDYDDLFEDGKPVIIGGMYKEKLEYGKFWHRVPKQVAKFVGYTAFIRCMTYFPLIFKVEHLRELRQHVEKFKHLPFNSAFETMNNGVPYSQFGVMCTYLWNNHRTEYSWHLQQTYGGEDIYQFVPDRSPRATPAWSQSVAYDMLIPKPRVAMHSSYVKVKMPNEAFYRYLLKAGYCLDEKLRNKRLRDCEGFEPYRVHKQFFCFERHDWTYHKNITDVFRHRQNRRKQRTHVWDTQLLKYLNKKEKGDYKPKFDVCN